MPRTAEYGFLDWLFGGSNDDESDSSSNNGDDWSGETSTSYGDGNDSYGT